MTDNDLDKRLNHVNYSYFHTNYRPSQFALQFVNFIKLVNGSEGEENESPIIHYDMIDQLVLQRQNLFVSFRGSAKTTALHEYLILYLATYGEIPGFGIVNVGMYISDTIDNGVKSMRTNLEFRWNNSNFLQKYVPKSRITDVRWEFTNADGKKLCFRGYGASTGVRGFKEYGERPTWCHKKGTVVTTDHGTHKVEDYPGIVLPSNITKGLEVKLCGLPDTETVTEEHQYMVKNIISKRNKQYLKNGNTESITDYEYSGDCWTQARHLGIKTKLGKQQVLNSWVASPINMTVNEIQPITYRKKVITERDELGRTLRTITTDIFKIHPKMHHENFWWMYGLWLADGNLATNALEFTIANTERNTVGAKLVKCFNTIGYKISKEIQRSGCYVLKIHDSALRKFLAKYKRGNSTKDIPEWVMELDTNLQRQILLGYIAGDGYEDYSNNQIRINSVNLIVLKQLGKISERLNMPYHIRNTKQPTTTKFPNGQVCNTQRQWEIRFREGVKEVLGFDIKHVGDYNPCISEVFIEKGFIYRKVKSVKRSEVKEFIPITTPSHHYLTDFGLNHNCGFDDLMSDKNAESPTITKDIKHIIYKAARQALHPKKRMQVWTGTPFNKSDPLYEAASSKAWNTRVYPICEKFPVSKKEFRGAWEDRFPYSFVKSEYDSLLLSGEISSFNQELMLRITSDEDRLVQEHDLVWYSRDKLLEHKSRYNFYITTDFATVNTSKGDFSVIVIWAHNNNGDWLLVDGICKRQLMDENIKDLFKFVSVYKPLEVGIEINGQQGGFISWIKSEMITKNVFFNLAGKGQTEGIRRTGKKIDNFKLVVPLIKAKKIWIPEELKNTPVVIELLEELRFATNEEFKSKHDDVADNISMLLEFDAYKPSQTVESEYIENEAGTFAWFQDDEKDLYKNSTVF